MFLTWEEAVELNVRRALQGHAEQRGGWKPAEGFSWSP